MIQNLMALGIFALFFLPIILVLMVPASRVRG